MYTTHIDVDCNKVSHETVQMHPKLVHFVNERSKFNAIALNGQSFATWRTINNVTTQRSNRFRSHFEPLQNKLEMFLQYCGDCRSILEKMKNNYFLVVRNLACADITD